jgi:hypothetical protein
MRLVRQLMLSGILLVTFVGIASAVPITFQLDNVTAVGGAFPAGQTYSPNFPIVGSGDIDFGAGTGVLTLPNYSIIIDVNFDGPDAQLDISGWQQTITSIDGGGNIVSTGSGTVGCTNLGGLGGFVCLLASPVVAGWPPPDGASLLSSAVIDTGAQTITIIDNSDANAGTITQFYSYSTLLVPEPGTLTLVSAGLVGVGLHRRRRR